MIALPAELHRWREALAILPEGLRVSFGACVIRLAVLFDRLGFPAAAGDGEPAGIDGLSRRGSYERLLASEWLLADEAPDEFLRRAAGGEHAFLHLARIRPDGKRRSVLLLDAGPETIGGPRIGLVAAAIVLAGRARSAGVPFEVGLLQGNSPRGLDAAALRSILSARTHLPPTPADLRRWRDRLGPSAADDLWVAGGPSLRNAGLSRVEITEPLVPGLEAIDVRVEALGRPARTARLPLPPQGVRTRLLRDPGRLGAPPAAPPRASLVGRLHLLAGDRRLVARERASGAVIVVPVPTQPSRELRLRSLVPSARDHRVFAVGSTGNTIAIATAGPDGSVIVDGLRGGPRRLAVDGSGFVPPPAGAPLLRMFVWPETRRSRAADLRLFLPDACNRVFVAERSDATALRSTGVVACAAAEDFVVGAEPAEGATSGAFLPVEHAEAPAAFGVYRLAAHGFEREAATDLGTPRSVMVGPRGAVATERGGRWRFPRRGGAELHVTASFGRVVGAWAPFDQPGLLVVDSADRELSWLGLHETRRIAVFGAPIEDIAIGATRPIAAVRLASGEVAVVQLEHRGRLLSLEPGGLG